MEYGAPDGDNRIGNNIIPGIALREVRDSRFLFIIKNSVVIRGIVRTIGIDPDGGKRGAFIEHRGERHISDIFGDFYIRKSCAAVEYHIAEFKRGTDVTEIEIDKRRIGAECIVLDR